MNRAKRHKSVLLLLALAGAFSVVGILAQNTGSNTDKGVLLVGTVTASGQKIEGVVVSARAEGSNITTSVYTDDQGGFYFPRLADGNYQVWAQTGGFATGHAEVKASGSGVKHQNFSLTALKDPEAIGKQMTGAEWLDSLPAETAADKRAKEIFRDTCTGCHTPAMALQNRFDEPGWEVMITLMAHTGGHGGISAGPPGLPFVDDPQNKKDLATYLAKVRGPEGVLQPKFHPRPKGEETLAVVREYGVPLPQYAEGRTESIEDGSDWSLGNPSDESGNRELHDSTPDFYGNLWFTASQENKEHSYGKVNLKTGKVTFFKIPGPGQEAALTHAIVRDPKGNLYFNISGYAGGPDDNREVLGIVDPKTDKLEIYAPPKSMVGFGDFLDVDNKGNVWGTASGGMIRWDATTRQFKAYKFLSGGRGGPYGVTTDINGNGWGSQFSSVDAEGRIDVETGQAMDVKGPPSARSERVKALFSPADIALYEKIGSRGFTEGIPWVEGVRRPQGDKNSGGDSVWVPDWWGGNLMRINIYNYQTKLFPTPTAEVDGAYDLKVDKNHMVWADFQNSEIIGKLDPATGKWLEYRLPTLGTETHAIGYIDNDPADGRTKIAITSFHVSKVGLMEFRTKQEVDALKAAARNVTASK